ncbi:hypothetical protein JQX13_13485 [Archangium violaceum]|uniref:hypothetical protein n=1 Tax=Archangium violaceum TaxID=83451 RepID=UPI00193C7E70|nr:hypothetical protein [Archangium violaceum]QRK10985.1 hypothetical protein JQX13_13485 [Archangium violaceum]
MSQTYKGLTQPFPIDTVGPDGKKRPIHDFPKVGGFKKVPLARGLEAFELHFPSFLQKRRGSEPVAPDLGTSLHLLLEVEDEQQHAEIIRRVVREEVPGTFGKYLDAIHVFNVTLHREARTMQVSVELTPHGAEAVAWSFELRFPSEEEGRQETSRLHPSPHAMNDPRAAELIRVARHYYPAGYPVWEDDDEAPVPAHQLTPEYQRWSASRQKTWDDWSEWKDFLGRVRAAFSGHDVRDVTYPSADACSRCCVYLRESLPDGGRVVTRVVGAVCILAPLYLVYATTVTVRPDKTSTRPLLTFVPTGDVKPFADTLARYIEQVFGYRPFPLELADVPLPELRVGSLDEPPTLLGALFAARGTLENLP